MKPETRKKADHARGRLVAMLGRVPTHDEAVESRVIHHGDVEHGCVICCEPVKEKKVRALFRVQPGCTKYEGDTLKQMFFCFGCYGATRTAMFIEARENYPPVPTTPLGLLVKQEPHPNKEIMAQRAVEIALTNERLCLALMTALCRNLVSSSSGDLVALSVSAAARELGFPKEEAEKVMKTLLEYQRTNSAWPEGFMS